MPIRENSIHSPREEMAQLQKDIEREKEVRRSLRISASFEYYSSQKEYLEAQIKIFQDKLDTLTSRYENAELEIAASHARQKKCAKRYALLKHREKIARIQKFQEEVAALQKEIEDED